MFRSGCPQNLDKCSFDGSWLNPWNAKGNKIASVEAVIVVFTLGRHLASDAIVKVASGLPFIPKHFATIETEKLEFLVTSFSHEVFQA